LSGFIKPSEGQVHFAGEDITGSKPNRIAARGLVRTFQHATLFEGLNVFENVLVASHQTSPRGLKQTLPGRALISGEAVRQDSAWRALRVVGLDDCATDMPKDLPYGKQRLLSLAIAISAGPSLLLLDEPAAGLNPVEAESLANILRRLRDEGLTVLLIEHNVRMMAALCDRIVVIHHGEKIGEGTPAEVRADKAVRDAYFGDSSDA
ncbi:MAG: ATP-binding cassette domain-containing protein, partial [Proteobacteria bacterium]|nr:ATP-binding cassette domain-containing protein [Pseudomonadota bacterium]